uniref:Receptor expression-enhancing protein n=1 Tax=Zooxanthella nutricula TaxID=1333877 RepID=A0A6U6NCZ6_9DINO
MLPYFLILPLWLLAAVGLPLVQSLHALQAKSEDRKTWLFYWICFAIASTVLCYFEWVIQIPFYVLAFYVDLYYEAQLLLVLWLVFPKFLGIKQVQAHLESNATALGKKGLELAREHAVKAREVVLEFKKKYT